MTAVAVIGLGAMGSRVAAHPLNRGHDVTVRRVERFLAQRLDALTTARIAPGRLIIDSGPGHIRGSRPERSQIVLGALRHLKGADYIRTHDVTALRDALTVPHAIARNLAR